MEHSEIRESGKRVKELCMSNVSPKIRMQESTYGWMYNNCLGIILGFSQG